MWIGRCGPVEKSSGDASQLLGGVCNSGSYVEEGVQSAATDHINSITEHLGAAQFHAVFLPSLFMYIYLPPPTHTFSTSIIQPGGSEGGHGVLNPLSGGEITFLGCFSSKSSQYPPCRCAGP